MATTSIETRPQLAPNIRWLLGRLRVSIRCYVWLEGLASAAAWLGVAFWGTLAIDWFFEPRPAVRMAMLVIVGLVFIGVLVQLIGRRTFVPLSDSSMAMLLERRYTRLDDSLLTAVALTGRRPDPVPCNPQMLERTCRQAAERIQKAGLLGVFNVVPLLRGVAAAVLLAGSVVAFGLMFPGALNTWAQRSLFFSTDLWPRKTRMMVEGFQDGVEKVARGADFEVIAMADTRWPVVPKTAQIRYRIEGGRRDRKTMNRRGTADPTKDPFQRYSHTFQGVLAPITFEVKGNDHLVKGYRIQVVDNPTVDNVTLEYQYPEYMDRPTRTFPFTGVMQVPVGTRITMRAGAKKELVRVRIDSIQSEGSLPRKVLESDDLAGDRRGFRYTLEPLHEDTTLLFTLSDTDGITSREPFRLALAATPDAVPQLSARLDGIGTAITAQARLPAAGSVRDDYGIRRVWFQYRIDEQDPAEQEIGTPEGQTTEWNLDSALEVGPLQLAPGQKLLVSIRAADYYDLGPEQNVGTSDRWLLDVVTPEQLRAMLQRRELVLRQRFEQILQEVTETRDLLLRIEFGAPDAPAQTEDQADQAKSDGASEPGDEPEDEEEPMSPERQRTLRTLQTQRALQNSRKNAQETEGVAEAFNDIRLQFVNNGIHTEELVVRLKQRIADPLHSIAGEMFPALELSLERLREKLDDDELGPQRRDQARQQADDVLMEMQKVLEQMLELETFNEALELLQEIIKLQEQLDEQTKQRHKQKLRELLED